MAQSATVVSKTLATAAAYNNLRLDVLSTTLGHTHDGTDGKVSVLLDNIAVTMGTGSDSKIYYDGTDSFWDLRAVGTGDLMIALAGSFPSPDPDAVHIWGGTAGAVTAPSSSRLIIENDATAFISFLVPDGQNSGLQFGDASDNNVGAFIYRHTTNDFQFNMGATTAALWSATKLTLSDGVEINMQEAIVWTAAGAAVTGTDYSIGRDDSTVMHTNVPTGATYEWSVNDVYIMGLTATELAVAAGVDFKVDSIIEGNGLSGVSISGLQVSGTGLISRTAGVYVYQDVSSGAVPALIINQTDVSEEMMEFMTTIGTGNAIEAIASKTLTTTHFIKITIPGGLTRYIPCGTIA